MITVVKIPENPPARKSSTNLNSSQRNQKSTTNYTISTEYQLQFFISLLSNCDQAMLDLHQVLPRLRQ